MSGFLSGWLREEPLEECLRLGNACGAIVVSRHGCSPAMPTPEELEYFLNMPERPRSAPRRRVAQAPAPRHYAQGARGASRARHRPPLAARRGSRRARGGPRASARAQGPSGRAFRRVAEEEIPRRVCLLDDVYGDKALEELTGSGLWISRAAEVAGTRPVEFVGGTERRRQA